MAAKLVEGMHVVNLSCGSMYFFFSQLDGGLLCFLQDLALSLQINKFKPMLKNELGFFSCSHFDISSLSFQTQLNRVSEPCWSSACLEPLKLPNCLAPLSVSHAISQKANNLSLSHCLHVPGGKQSSQQPKAALACIEHSETSISF